MGANLWLELKKEILDKSAFAPRLDMIRKEPGKSENRETMHTKAWTKEGVWHF